MVKYLFDTDVLIDHLRGYSKIESLLLEIANLKAEGMISAIVELELYAGEKCNNEEEREQINKLLSLFKIIEVSSEIAFKAAEYKRVFKLEVPDAITAATAFIKNARVVTRNLRHFKKIEEIVLFQF